MKPYRPTKEEVTGWLGGILEPTRDPGPQGWTAPGRSNYAYLCEAYLLALDVIEASRWAPAQMTLVESRTQLQLALNKWDGSLPMESTPRET